MFGPYEKTITAEDHNSDKYAIENPKILNSDIVLDEGTSYMDQSNANMVLVQKFIYDMESCFPKIFSVTLLL